MGKCSSCLKVPLPTQQQNPSFNSSLNYPSVNHEVEEKTDVSESVVVGAAVEGQPQPSASDSESSTSDKTSVVVNVHEKKSFYSRLPSLNKPTNEVKKNSKEYSEAKITSLFDIYKDEDCDAILTEGIETLCMDLDVKPEEFIVLVLAWKFGAEKMCRFTRSEFMSGCKALKVDSIKGIQGKFSDMLQEVRDPEEFKKLYRFTFKFGLDVDTGQRSLPSDMAVVLWRLVFSQQEPIILKRWLMFLERHPNIRGIPRDTWNMFLNFSETVGEDLSTYDDTEAWPSLFDDFVEYENDKLNQNISKDHMHENE